jgi:menaquinone-dependent protoporphyrinogen IX oxidase
MKILSLFSQTKEEKDVKIASRAAKALKRGQEALIDSLEARRDKAQETMDKLVEGKISAINTSTFNQTYHDAKLEIVLVDKEIEIARGVQSDLYSDVAQA